MPFRLSLTFPSAVLGPVEKRQGRFSRAALRSLSRPSGVTPLRIDRLRRPAATLLGLGVCAMDTVRAHYYPVRSAHLDEESFSPRTREASEGVSYRPMLL